MGLCERCSHRRWGSQWGSRVKAKLLNMSAHTVYYGATSKHPQQSVFLKTSSFHYGEVWTLWSCSSVCVCARVLVCVCTGHRRVCMCVSMCLINNWPWVSYFPACLQVAGWLHSLCVLSHPFSFHSNHLSNHTHRVSWNSALIMYLRWYPWVGTLT